MFSSECTIHFKGTKRNHFLFIMIFLELVTLSFIFVVIQNEIILNLKCLIV
jgi:hypothetical protein